MQIRTGALNNAHRRLRRRVRGSRVARGVYDVGSVCGVAGVVFGYYVIYSSFFASSPPSPSKRSLTLQPIIPGVTTPLSHLPVIVLCVVLCQCIHELGHAVAAAVEDIPLLSAGLSLSSAFVALPPLGPRCSLRGQLRIIAAGPFHNLLTFLVLAALPRLAALLPSTDLSHVGALVLSVDAHSVLRPYLPTGTIITHLDDYPLFHPSHPLPWDTYLLAPSPPPPLSPYDSPPDTLPHHGWCLPSPQFLNAPSSCCDRSPNPHSPPDPSSHLACFDALNTTPSSRCIDPIPILTQSPLPPYPNLSPPPQTPYKRCSSARDCSGPQAIGEAYTCVLPRPSEHLLRITILASSPSNTSAQLHVQQENTMQLQTLLWTGPRREIYDQVHTTQHLPFLFPPSLPLHSLNEGKWGWALILSAYARLAPGARLLYTYTSLASLSLYTLNLLPLPHLDGAHFLAALLTLLLAPSTNSANHPPDVSFGRNGGGGWGVGGDGGGWGDEDEDGDGDGETLLPLYRTTGARPSHPAQPTHSSSYSPSSDEDDDLTDNDDNFSSHSSQDDSSSSSSSSSSQHQHPSQHQNAGAGPTPFAFAFTFAVPRAAPSSSPSSPSYHNPSSHTPTSHTTHPAHADTERDIESGLPPPSSSPSSSPRPSSSCRSCSALPRIRRPRPRLLLRAVRPLRRCLLSLSSSLSSLSSLSHRTRLPPPPARTPTAAAVPAEGPRRARRPRHSRDASTKRTNSTNSTTRTTRTTRPTPPNRVRRRGERLAAHAARLTLLLLAASLLCNLLNAYAAYRSRTPYTPHTADAS